MMDKGYQNALEPGHCIHWYEIERTLGKGAFGTTYLAQDTNLHQSVAIKEFLPPNLAIRAPDNSIQPLSEYHRHPYERGLERFIKEARILSQFDHPNIVRVLAIFEHNNTAYLVMRYEHGENLRDILKHRKTLEEGELRHILFPILDGLEHIHQGGFLHRDIKPSNIFIREDGSPLLLDFGSARGVDDDTKTLTSLVSSGYSPFEQYYSKSDQQGPWTDIYGLGATLYRAISGHQPVDAVDRSKTILKEEPDPLIPAEIVGAGSYAEDFLKAIDHALQFKEEDRPASIAEWRAELLGAKVEGAVPPASAEAPTQPAPALWGGRRPPPSEQGSATQKIVRRRRRAARWPLWAGTFAALLLGLIGAWLKGPELPSAEIFASSEAPPFPKDKGPVAGEKENPAAPDSLAAQIQSLVAQGEEDLKAKRLSEPSGQNALDKFRAVLLLDPDNQAAKAGLQGIMEGHLRLAQEAMGQDDLDGASEHLEKAEEVFPQGEKLNTVREELQKRMGKAAGNTLEPIADTPPSGAAFHDLLKAGGRGPQMIVVAPATFQMGDLDDQGTKEEEPVHPVHFAKPFAIGAHEVTVGEFRRFADATGYRSEAEQGSGCYVFNGKWEGRPNASWRDPGFKQGSDHPVVCLSHHDALAYAKWLSRQTGRTYRLPSEAEWEYAARAGTATARPWGDAPEKTCDYANVADGTANKAYPNWHTHPCEDGFVWTAPTGRFKPNGYGLYDVLGNVWEWTQDCWHPSYVGAPDDGRPREGDPCQERVIRGNSWFHYPADLRSAFRFKQAPVRSDVTIGFRLAADLE